MQTDDSASGSALAPTPGPTPAPTPAPTPVPDYYANRLSEVLWNRNAYPHKFSATMQVGEFVATYGSVPTGPTPSSTEKISLHDYRDRGAIPNNTYVHDRTESLLGRVTLLRTAGKKLIFMTVSGDGKEVQFLANQAFSSAPETFKELHTTVRRGDIVGAVGHPGRSKTGELSLYVTRLERLAPCLHEVPVSAIGISDPELRARRRYLDLIVNPASRVPFELRAKIIGEIRRYLDSRNFLEVSTPILFPQVGGASAKPFVTFHNDLKVDMFLRVSPELFLKQLIVGGFERVYEIGPQFRNESITYRHNPEFTSLEFYMVGADYRDLMTMCEELVRLLVLRTNKTLKIRYVPHGAGAGSGSAPGDDADTGIELDFESPFAVVDMIPALEKETGQTFPTDFTTEEARCFLSDLCVTHHVPCPQPRTSARLIDKLAGHFIESRCVQPTFVIHHPRVMSPLAKWHRDHPQLTERFELFICGMEFANAYTELNDPLAQREAFATQMDDRRSGDAEAQEMDHGFIRALEYGMCPTGGFGLGVDRMVMLLSNRQTIRDVILFPTLAPETG